jgi:hypothetical protein
MAPSDRFAGCRLPDGHPIIRIKKFCPDWTEFQNHPTSVQLGQKFREN